MRFLQGKAAVLVFVLIVPVVPHASAQLGDIYNRAKKKAQETINKTTSSTISTASASGHANYNYCGLEVGDKRYFSDVFTVPVPARGASSEPQSANGLHDQFKTFVYQRYQISEKIKNRSGTGCNAGWGTEQAARKQKQIDESHSDLSQIVETGWSYSAGAATSSGPAGPTTASVGDQSTRSPTQDSPTQNGPAFCRPVTELFQKIYPDLRLTPGSSGSCTYKDPAKTNVSGRGPTLVVDVLQAGKPLEVYSRPMQTVRYQVIPNLGQLAELLTFNAENSYFSVYRNDKCALDMHYFQWPMNDSDIANIPIIVNSLLGPSTAERSTRPLSPARATPSSASANPPDNQDSSNCTRVTAAVRQYFSEAQPNSSAPGSCDYVLPQPHYERFPIINMSVRLYGDHGEPIQDYQRPKVANKDGYRTYSGIGQIAEYLYLPNWQAMFLVYRNNKRVLDIKFTNCDCEFLNPVIDGSRLVAGLLLGPYKTQAAPLSEPTAPPQ